MRPDGITLIASGSPRPKTSRPQLRAGPAAPRRPCAWRRAWPGGRPARAAISSAGASSALRLLGLGQQQARLQVGQPGGHHQIVGGQRELRAPRLLHEGQVLVGQLQDRELAAGRPSGCGPAPAARAAGPRSRRGRRSAPRRPRPRWRRRRSRGWAGRPRSCRPPPVEGRVEARAAPRRRRTAPAPWRAGPAPPRRAPRRRPVSSPRARRPPPSSRPCRRCSAGPRRSRRRSAAAARSAKSPLSAFIDRSSLITRPSKPIAPRITRRDHLAARWWPGASASMAV